MLRPMALSTAVWWTMGWGTMPGGFLAGAGRTVNIGCRRGGRGLEGSGRGHAGGGGASSAWRTRAVRVFKRSQIIHQRALGLYSDGASLPVAKPNRQ